MLATIFKQYDIRGKYPSQINEVIVLDIIRKFPMIFGEKGVIVVGHDARHSSPTMYRTAINTLRDMDYEVIAVGLVTTPMMMFLTQHYRAGGSIMITASHNPKDQNGIKIIDRSLNVIGGKEIFGKITEFFSGAEPVVMTSRKKRAPREKSAEAAKKYVAFLEKFFDKGSKGKKIKFVIDCSNGSAGTLIKKMRFPKNIRPIILNANPDGNFPAHGPNPMEARASAQARKEIIKQKADFGVVMDGDGDRALFLDNKGRIVRPEYMWRLIAQHEKYRKIIVTELNAYLVKKITVASPVRNAKLFLSKVGRLSVLHAMKSHDADFGFENSGHYYFKEFFYSDCGILAWIKALLAIQVLPYSLADFIDLLPQSVRLPEYDVPAKRVTPALYHTIADMLGKKAKHISFFESVSILFENSFLNVRNSNTEDVVRVTTEGENAPELRKLQKKAVSIIKEMTK